MASPVPCVDTISGLSKEDAEALLARLKDVFGGEPAQLEAAGKFMLTHNDGLRAKPIEVIRNSPIGIVRVLDYLKDARGRP